MSSKPTARHGAVSSFSFTPKKPLKGAKDSIEKIQRDLYRQAWTDCSQQVHATLSSLHDASLSQIVQFVDDSAAQPSSLLTILSGRQSLRTGLIIGVSPGSSDLLFTSLCRQLSTTTDSFERATSDHCVVSRISSKSCSTIKSAMKALITGFIGSALEEEDSDGEGITPAATLRGKKRSLTAPEDMQNLLAWYTTRYAGKAKPTLVWLLEDLESMNAQVLDTMIHTCSRYLPSLPLVLLIGVATSANALGKAIPRSTMNLLDTANFFVEPGVDAFNALIRGLFIESNSPISIGPKVYTYILKTFQDLNHCIDGTISYLQYIYMNHFERDISLFTLPPSPATIKMLTPEIRDSIRGLKSVTTLAKDSQDFLDLNSNEEDFLAVIERCRLEKEEWQSRLGGGMKVLRILLSHWSRTEVESDLLGSILDGKFVQRGALTGLSVDSICSFILQSNELKFTKFLSLLSTHLDLEPFDPELTPIISAAVESMQLIGLKPKLEGRQNFVNSNANFVEGSVLGGGDKEFSALVKGVATTLADYFRQCFRPCTELLLHEIWSSNLVKPLSEFHPSILPAFQRSLQLDQTSEAPPLDIRIAYNLYQDTGRIINLSDWFGAFQVASHTEVEAGEDGQRRKRARFVRALGSLAHVGFVAPTSKKVEHVAKNIF